MSTIDLLTQRIDVLEKQLALLLTDKQITTDTKKPKKEKKSHLVTDDEPKSKKKRVSGYLTYSSAMRDEVKKYLFGENKSKNSEIMVELGKRWKALSQEERDEWNNKASAIKD